MPIVLSPMGFFSMVTKKGQSFIMTILLLLFLLKIMSTSIYWSQCMPCDANKGLSLVSMTCWVFKNYVDKILDFFES